MSKVALKGNQIREKKYFVVSLFHLVKKIWTSMIFTYVLIKRLKTIYFPNKSDADILYKITLCLWGWEVLFWILETTLSRNWKVVLANGKQIRSMKRWTSFSLKPQGHYLRKYCSAQILFLGFFFPQKFH